MLRATTPTKPALPQLGSQQSPTQRTFPWRVVFCGPIAEVGKAAAGGYEAANRRTCDALIRRGLSVIELPYPKPTASPLKRLLLYVATFAKAGSYLIARRHQYDLLHLTPLNMHFALAETLLVSCAKLLGKPVLVDVRAGTFVRHYEKSGALYRHTIDRTLRHASQVAVEGQEFIPFVRQRTRQPVFYFPNYVDNPSLRKAPATERPQPSETVRLMYFGRLVAEKGIETALLALALLVENGLAAHLEFIGDGPAAYLTEIQGRYAHLPVTWTAGLPVDDILKRAGKAHFFFFASRHDGEGHSNALNEAMSVGLVPVCSAQGFTRSVVGNAGVVLSTTAQPKDYATAIEEILSSSRWSRLSDRARTRIRTLYSEQSTLPALIDIYRKLLTTR